MWASVVMRESTEMGGRAACPWEDLAPLSAWMADLISEKVESSFQM